MKQPIRYFAIGLLTAAVLSLATFYFSGGFGTKIDRLSTEEMIEAIKMDGYRVVKEEEYISLSVRDDKQTDAEEDDNAAEEIQEKESAKTFKVDIKSGMLPSEISEILAENDIIKDAAKFTQYLE